MGLQICVFVTLLVSMTAVDLSRAAVHNQQLELALTSIIRDTGSGLTCTDLYQVQVKVLFKLIQEECPLSYSNTAARAPPATNNNELIWKQLYESLVGVLAVCRQLPTTAPIPAECLTAIDLTEGWRTNHNASYIQPINGKYNCDSGTMIDQGRPWFRFSGAAGNRLSDLCPPLYSCGTVVGLWSDDAMPTTIGVNKTITVNGYFNGNCKHYDPEPVRVIKCSNKAYDFIYKYDGRWHCPSGFCSKF